jgi:pimeloyl-ACP methyl ester carboxylesterase
LRRFASYGRLIFFDMRGIGLSDPVEDLPPLEEWMDDVRAVMDAVGSDRAAFVGHGHAGQLCMLVAAAHPDRVQALVTVNSFARLARAPGYRAGMPEGAQQTQIDAIRATWGTTDPLHLRVLAPDLADDVFARAWWARVERAAGSPRRAVRKQQLAFELDVREVRPVRSAASARSNMGSRRWACRSGWACTPARSSCSATMWAASPWPSPPA